MGRAVPAHHGLKVVGEADLLKKLVGERLALVGHHRQFGAPLRKGLQGSLDPRKGSTKISDVAAVVVEKAGQHGVNVARGRPLVRQRPQQAGLGALAHPVAGLRHLHRRMAERCQRMVEGAA